MKKNIFKNTSIIICLIAFAVAWRLINHRYNFAPNLELITAVSVLAAVIINYRASLITAFGSMVISDLIIGNTSIFIYTWSAFLLIGLGAGLLKKLNNKHKEQFFASIAFAIVGSFVFFVLTNLGVWLEGWYSMNYAGFIECFTLAIPFYRTMLIGNLILVPAVVSARQFFIARQSSRKLVIDSSVC